MRRERFRHRAEASPVFVFLRMGICAGHRTPTDARAPDGARGTNAMGVEGQGHEARFLKSGSRQSQCALQERTRRRGQAPPTRARLTRALGRGPRRGGGFERSDERDGL